MPRGPKAVSSAARQRSRPGQTPAISSAGPPETPGGSVPAGGGVGGPPGTQERERLVGDEFQRPAQTGAFEEAKRPVELRGRSERAEERALEVCEDRRARSGIRRKLLDVLRERGQVFGGARERGEGVPAGLVRQRDGHVRAPGQGLEQ